MQTRRQNPDQKKFRPDAFASSVEHDRGLLGNLVAARCHKLTDPEEITMLWWLQQLSWREGGMERFVSDFLDANQSQIGTRSMQKFGMGKGQVYNADQVRVVRAEMGRDDQFPLRGERLCDYSFRSLIEVSISVELAAREEEKKFPASYPVGAFIKACHLSKEELAETLNGYAVDPATESLKEGLWNFPTLWEALKEWRQMEIDAAKGNLVETQITRTVCEELDFALHSRSFILIEGREGVGKTKAAKNWCTQHPGQAVYVRLESGTDEATLYRSIARAIGTACSYGRKATEMKLRIQDALQPGQMMLVLDEAHFLWPQSDRSARSAPKRVDWLRTALIDFGVPIALISTPQYFARACDKFLKGGWNANQIQRRLAHTVSLPDFISAEEMKAVAKSYFPKASGADITRIAVTAATELGFLTVMQHLRKRVDFIAAKTPGRSDAECLDEALQAHPVPATPAPAAQVATPLPAAGKPPEGRLHGPGNVRAATVPGRAIASLPLSRIHREQTVLTMT
jgi:hypothetical protein